MRKKKIPEYLINWIATFLHERKFYVKINDTKNELKEITKGAPQGSIHSPLIYLIYTDDAPLLLRKHYHYSTLFARFQYLINLKTWSKQLTYTSLSYPNGLNVGDSKCQHQNVASQFSAMGHTETKKNLT